MRLRLGDLEVGCRVDGPQEAPPILLVGGLLTTHRIWDGLVERLGASWRLVRYDLRGHGDTTAIGGACSMTQLANDALAVLDALGIERAHFIGTSLGGMIGQHLGARHSHRLLSLTLANTAAVQAMPQAWQQRIEAACAGGLQPLVEATLQRWFAPECMAGQPGLVALVRQEALKTSVDGFVGCASAVRDLAQADLLPVIPVPTLVIAGSRDAAIAPADTRALHAAIARAWWAEIPAGHQAAAECPDEFAAAWLAFQQAMA